MDKTWTINELINLYKIEKTKTSIYRDEASGIIPKAKRIHRGKTEVRVWAQKDLPIIGEAYGFLSPPSKAKVISVYSPKGGVLKTTFALNLSRMLAINGIKVLVIGLDVQGSITNNLKPDDEVYSIEEIKNINGLYETIKLKDEKGCNIKETIQYTDLPTLFYIPESSNLNQLEQKIRDKNRREYFIQNLIHELKKNYKVIIFDNSPNWNFLIQNSLVAATDVICPIACEIETYRSLAQNIEMINDFKKSMELEWQNFILVPTKAERTKISSQIEAQYRTLFPELITSGSIRATVKGQESSLEKLSAIEYDSKSSLAEDYYGVIKDVWDRINPKKDNTTNKSLQHKGKAISR